MFEIHGVVLPSRSHGTSPVRTKGIKVPDAAAMSAMLQPIVEMLTRMAIQLGGVAES